jgi:predicted dehydrogenase
VAFRTPGARLVAVADPFEEMGKKVLELTGGIPDFHKDYVEMLDRPDIDAVIIGCVVDSWRWFIGIGPTQSSLSGDSTMHHP